uniref:Uncharacterized protein n=1 Tax=Pseudictyota dubia TaxID=2749911 RepID=A0A7R9YYB1_9STRA
MLAASAPRRDRIVPNPRGGISNVTGEENSTAEDVGCVQVFAFAEDSSTNASVTDWMQVGNEVLGDEAGDKLSAVSLSADGTSFATGSAVGGNGTGYVRVYGLVGDISSGKWLRMGGTLAGQESGQRFGSHLSLSRDARFIAVGSPFANSRGGAVRLFELGWIQVGEDLSRGSRLGEDFGYDISLATLGENSSIPRTRIAISAPTASSLTGEEETGAVFVYDVGLDHTFEKVGQTLYGAPGDVVRGYLSKDARRLAVGERYNDGTNGTQKNIGLVRVFELSTNATSERNWTGVGQMLYGDERNEQSGKAFRLNYDGSIIAIGAKMAEGKKGRVRVYEIQKSGDILERKWIPRGQDLIGENPGEGLGGMLDISDDGTVVVTSGSTTDKAGFIRVYKYRPAAGMWDKVGNDIYGEAAEDRFGGYTAISGDGRIVAGGSKRGFEDERGYIRVFEFDQDANEWEKIGGNIDGEEADANLRVVSLSEDGRRVGTSSGETQNHTGFVAVYDLVNGRWNRVGGKIFGQKPKTNFGHVHALSRDGSRLVATAPAHGQKSLGLEPTMLGLVRLYDLPPPFAN